MRNISKAGTFETPPKEGELDDDVDTLGQLLLQLGRVRPLRDPIGQALAAMNINPAQMHTMLWLGSDGPLTMGEIARRLGITEKTVTGIVDRLERDKYCQRVR